MRKIMSNTTVLIIDDNESNILVLEHLLRRQNIPAKWLTSTHDLSSKLDTLQSVKAVFLDLMMPETDGCKALSIIREHPNFKGAKVIAYSVHIRSLETAIQMGFDGFLDKPMNAKAFPEQLRQILESKSV
jgi:two-component system cell cycle response regulator DivK